MSLKKNKKQESNKETKQHQNRGARGLEEDALERQRSEQEEFTGDTGMYQGEYHEEGKKGVRGNTSPEPKGIAPDNHAQGKGGTGQNNLGQHNDQDDDFQSGSKGGNRSGKTGTRQGGHRGQGTK